MGEASAQAARARRLLLGALKAPGDLPALPLADWDLLLRVARRARLLGRIEADLAAADLLGAIPERAGNHLRAARNVVAHRHTLTTWEVDRILWGLEGVDVRPVLLKGVAYVMAGLPPARGRLFADVDLMVPEARIEEVEKTLLGRGWFRKALDPYDERYYRVWSHEIPPLRHRERETEIDIHHTILPRTSRLKPDPALLFAAARPLPALAARSGASPDPLLPADPRLQVLAPADMVLHSLVHLFLEGDPQDGLRLRDLVDAHDLLRHFGAEPDFWGSLVPRARELGLTRPLYYGLRYARRLLGADVPHAVRAAAKKAAPPAPVRALMDRLVPLALFPEHPDFPRRRAARARLLIYVRSHWLRMPPLLLARHLGYKAWLRVRRVPRKVELTQLDLKQ
ncbi:MAG: nucleotidyltransferase family protein [Gammaproteobacteria bacterium]|nr:nucleotidyltransferase family protein [Gammaproteobacteria bacterium]